MNEDGDDDNEDGQDNYNDGSQESSTNDDSIPDRSVCNIHVHMGTFCGASLAELSYTIA